MPNEFTEKEIKDEMIAIAIDFMNEEEACYYCRFQGTEDCHNGCSHSDWFCTNGIYNGLEFMAKRNLKEAKLKQGA